MLKVRSMCKAIAQKHLKDSQKTINVNIDDSYMFFQENLTDNECYVYDYSTNKTYFLKRDEDVNKLIEMNHPILGQLQKVYNGSKHHLDVDIPQEGFTFVSVVG